MPDPRDHRDPTAPRDPLVDLAAGRFTGPLVRALGLPRPRALRREAGPCRADELARRRAVVGGGDEGWAAGFARDALGRLGASVADAAEASGAPLDTARVDIAVLDATACRDVADLDALRTFFGPLMRRLAHCARLLVIGEDPARRDDPVARAASQALDGFVRSLAKEAGRDGATANLLWTTRDAVDRLATPLRFLCSHRAAYVSGRSLHVDARVRRADPVDAPPEAARPPFLSGRLAVVTGAARGLGAATAGRLAEEGARVLCIDVPAAEASLHALAARLGGEALPLDITAREAPARLAAWLREAGTGVDVLVHNAGITRDRTLRNLSETEWRAVMAVNLQAVIDLDDALDRHGLLREGAREVLLSSISGLAGNVGQANYAASKAALVGYASARADRLASRGITVNAVAPGFIETDMTRRIPFLVREAGRRMNALSQGGQPRDVAEAVAFLALPGADGVTGQALRVCGQALMGA